MGAKMIRIEVSGIPKPGGSKRGFYRGGKVIITDACKGSKDWKSLVAYSARQQYQGNPLTGSIRVYVTFKMPRPKYHFKKNGMPSAKLETYHTKKPDATKLMRSTEDALTGILWADDSQIYHQEITKIYGAQPGAVIEVEEII
jgi:Holliday junction resolvase RusA-like endonuclease